MLARRLTEHERDPEAVDVSNIRLSAAGKISLKGLVVRLVDEIRLTGPLVPQGGEQPPETLPNVGEIHLYIPDLLELLSQRIDALLQLAIARA